MHACREKHNRRGQNRQRGDGVDLQFINNRFIELRAVTTERSNMSWVLKGFIDHPDADAVLFLALNHENLKAWLRERTIGENRISHQGKEFEIKIENVNDHWIVGIVKTIKNY